MNSIAPNETVTLTIGKAEALILFELLFDFYSQSALEIKDEAERLALVRIHSALESKLVEPFSKPTGKLAVPLERASSNNGAIHCLRNLR